jgi:hypothetical protein
MVFSPGYWFCVTTAKSASDARFCGDFVDNDLAKIERIAVFASRDANGGELSR